MCTYKRQEIIDMIGVEKLENALKEKLYNALNKPNCEFTGSEVNGKIEFKADLGEFEAEIYGELEEVRIVAVWRQHEDDVEDSDELSDLDWDQVSYFFTY